MQSIRSVLSKALSASAIIATTLVLSACSKTISWSEEVRLHDGSVTWIDRAAIRGPDAFGIRGRGTIERVSITLKYKGREIRWSHDRGDSDVYELPRILDLVNDKPVVVFPVIRENRCRAYGYPPEGMVAQQFDHGEWTRVPISALPRTLQFNLLADIHAVEYSDYSPRVTLAEKAREELLEPPGRLGMPLADASQFYSKYDRACAELAPPPGPAHEPPSAAPDRSRAR